MVWIILELEFIKRDFNRVETHFWKTYFLSRTALLEILSDLTRKYTISIPLEV